jgi:hypothetical protein
LLQKGASDRKNIIVKRKKLIRHFRKPDLKTVFDTDKKPPVSSREGKGADSSTPMKKIQQNRAKWRDSQKKNLEESWGSLNMFDRHQKGRISMDLDGIIYCQILAPLLVLTWHSVHSIYCTWCVPQILLNCYRYAKVLNLSTRSYSQV